MRSKWKEEMEWSEMRGEEGMRGPCGIDTTIGGDCPPSCDNSMPCQYFAAHSTESTASLTDVRGGETHSILYYIDQVLLVMSSPTRATNSSVPSLPRPASTLLSPPPPTSIQPVSSCYLFTALNVVMEYSLTNLPPPDWLFARHGLPAIFRDTFGHTTWWTSQQQTAIKTAFDRWASSTYDHPFHACSGYVLPASTRAAPAVQRRDRQRHTLRYFVDQLHRTDSTAGIILYGVDVSTHPLTATFRTGPAGLNLHQFDVLYHSGTCNLTLITGMCKTWTRPHVDTAGDSVWQMLVEGEKMWILARPEKKDAMKVHFHDNRTMRWSQLETEDKDWLVDNRCLMVLQKAGDLLYIPKGWPHMCTHLTDTIALNSNLLHTWDFASAMDGMDFNRLSEEEVAMYQAAYTLSTAIDSTTPVGLRWGVREAEAAWERKTQERMAGAAEKEREMKEAEAAEAAKGEKQGRKKRKGG